MIIDIVHIGRNCTVIQTTQQHMISYIRIYIYTYGQRPHQDLICILMNMNNVYMYVLMNMVNQCLCNYSTQQATNSTFPTAQNTSETLSSDSTVPTVPGTRFQPTTHWGKFQFHRENGGTLGMVPWIINPIYTLYSGYLLGIPPSKGLLGGLKQLGYHPRVPAFSLWQLLQLMKHKNSLQEIFNRRTPLNGPRKNQL